MRKDIKRGSMTIEAAMILPLFLTAMILVGYLMNMTYVHRAVLAALENACRKASAYSYVTRTASGKISETGGELISLAYIQNSVTEELSDKPLVQKMLQSGVNCLNSEISEDGQVIDVIGRYTIRIPFSDFLSTGFSYVQRARMNGWAGYYTSGEESDEEEEIYVFVTTFGLVYHFDADCTYLRPDIHKVDVGDIASERNRSGEKYTACKYCCNGNVTGDVYISAYGTCYHTSKECSRIDRTVQWVPLSEVQGKRPCSKCGGTH